MRKAGDIAAARPETAEGLAAELIQQQSMGENTGPHRTLPLISSHHVDLDSRRIGIINDGIPKSTIYKGGKNVEADGDQFANPIKRQGKGAKSLRDMTPQEYQQFEMLYRRAMPRGTGDWAGL